ncbi:MAG: PepSY domain-containing protein [Gemmatimonadota bacterium]
MCVKDFAAAARCVTCAKLAPSADIPDEIVSAAARLVPRGAAKSWSLARDGGRYVVEINLGWTRRVVFTVVHGTAEAIHVRRHSIFGTTVDS